MSGDVNPGGGQAAPAETAESTATPKSLMTEGVSFEGDAPSKTLMTEGVIFDGDGKEAPKPEEKPGEGQAAVTVPDQPEGYVLKFAEGLVVDEASLGDFQKVAHELKLTSGQAQKLADYYAAKMSGGEELFRKAQHDALIDAKVGWEKEIEARPGYKAEIQAIKRTLSAFGSQELVDALDESMFGSYPPLYKFMVNVGQALPEPVIRGEGDSKTPETPLYKRMWPNG